MPKELLCDSCQRLLRGENNRLDQKNGYLSFIHHATAESFHQALALPCGICGRLRADFRRRLRYQSGDTFQVAPTTYHIDPPVGGEEIVEKETFLRFTCSEITIYVHVTPEITVDPSRWIPSARSGFAVAPRSLAADYTGSDACIDFILSELRQCQDTHIKCRNMTPSRQQTSDFLPTRIIDVGYTGGASMIRLLEADDCTRDTPYIALSHCWGNSQPLQLRRTTAARLRAGISSKDLPKTFQDAVYVARKMQVRYLWIDSLCIVQDDPQDWHREAARMRDVYSRAICCIAATAAKDSNTGLFFNRDPRGLLPMRVETTRARIQGQKTIEPLVAYIIGCMVVTPAIAIDAAPLNQRAWVAQERYLSTGTIHFTQELIFWECRTCVTSEQDPGGAFISITSKHLGESAAQMLKSLVFNYKDQQTGVSGDVIDAESSNGSSRIYREWCAFRTVYSGSHLTKEGDILVALNGVAQDVAEATNDTLVAGLWRGRLIEDMGWRRLVEEDVRSADTPSRPSIWRAPTWSWASINHTVVGYELWWEDESYSTLTNDMVTIENLSLDQQPSGELIDASMTLICRLIPMCPPKSGDGAWVPYDVAVVLDDFTSLDSKYLDHEASLVILRYYGSTEEGFAQGILLLPSRVKMGSYERVGYFDITYDDDLDDSGEKRRIFQSVLDAYDDAEETTIELI